MTLSIVNTKFHDKYPLHKLETVKKYKYSLRTNAFRDNVGYKHIGMSSTGYTNGSITSHVGKHPRVIS